MEESAEGRRRKRRDDDSDDGDDGRAKRRKHHRSTSRHKRDHHSSSSRKKHSRHDGDKWTRQRERYCESSSEQGSDSSDERFERKRRKKEKKRRHEEKKKHKKKRQEERGSKSNRNDNDHLVSQELERNHAFASALCDLLNSHPEMATEIPIVLIRLAGGTTLDLRQMSDQSASRGLEQVLSTLSMFGVKKRSDGCWGWSAPGGGSGSTGNELLLVKISGALLDQLGVTIDAVQNYNQEMNKTKQSVATKNYDELGDLGLIQAETGKLLDKFNKETDNATPTLAQELGSLCNMILSGEIIALDGLPDEQLRRGIEQIFATAGLEKSEMEDESDEEENETGESVMGYGIPESDADGGSVRSKILAALDTCQNWHTASHDKTNQSIRGATMMPSKDVPINAMHEDVDDEDDDVGPAPLGSKNAKRRVQLGPALPPEDIKAMAERRKREMEGVTSGFEPSLPSGEITEREQWMMEPGQHEFLQGIKSGAPLKNRTFQNKKQSSMKEAEAPVDPTVQAEMDAIMKMHRDARGPSLVEQHRLKKAEEKAMARRQGGKTEWKWSRDSDLDAGRRVDKNALNMIMGGAAGDLKDKFQGGLSRGFT